MLLIPFRLRAFFDAATYGIATFATPIFHTLRRFRYVYAVTHTAPFISD